MRTVWEAYQQVKANRGAAGIATRRHEAGTVRFGPTAHHPAHSFVARSGLNRPEAPTSAIDLKQPHAHIATSVEIHSARRQQHSDFHAGDLRHFSRRRSQTDETISGNTGVARNISLGVSPSGYATATWWEEKDNWFRPWSASFSR